MKKVAMYARVSTDKQTCENQLIELRAVAERCGYTIVTEFVDTGISVVFPQFTRHFSQRTLTLPLELMGAELIEVLMASNTIVETLDVIEDF